MYIFKNAFISIIRNKGRNLLIGIIILVISCAISVTLAINNSSSSLIKSYESKYELEATIGMNRTGMMENFNPQDRENSKDNMRKIFNLANKITEDDIKNYANSIYVKNYYYTMQIGVNSDTLESASMSLPNNNGNFGGRGPGGEDFKNISSGDFILKGYSSLEAMNSFIDGSYTVTDGEVFTDFDSNNCLINSELATLNEINVGDTISVIDSGNNVYELVVIGIYEEKNNEDNVMSMFTNSVNTIITNTNFISKIKENNNDLNISTTPTFVLNDSYSIEKFESELREKGLSEYLTVQTNLDQVKNATSTISNVKTFSITFLIITVIIGTIVLLVINMINIRERKYEIGVLRTIGMKKSKVCCQFIIELLMVSFSALILGCCIGATMSVPISNNLLKNEINASQNEMDNIRDNFGKGPNGQMGRPNNNFENNRFQGVATVQAFDSIDAVVDFKVLIELLGIGLLITLISSVSAIANIQKFSPLTILKERS